LHDRTAAFASLESLCDGSLQIVVHVPGSINGFDVLRCTVLIEVWMEGDAVRVSFRNPRTGSTAYVQGGAPLLALAGELGFEVRW
jgi:hypothetical protein